MFHDTCITASASHLSVNIMRQCKSRLLTHITRRIYAERFCGSSRFPFVIERKIGDNVTRYDNKITLRYEYVKTQIATNNRESSLRFLAERVSLPTESVGYPLYSCYKDYTLTHIVSREWVYSYARLELFLGKLVSTVYCSHGHYRVSRNSSYQPFDRQLLTSRRNANLCLRDITIRGIWFEIHLSQHLRVGIRNWML